MRPLLTMSEDDFRMCRENEVIAANSVFMLLEEIDAQRAEPTREPGEAALSQSPQDEAGTHLEGGKIGHWPTNVVVDAATIRRQVLEEAIAAFYDDCGLDSHVMRDVRRKLEALRDPADAREAGKG